MTWPGRKFFWGAICICLPAAAAAALMAFLVWKEVPEIVRDGEARVLAQTENAAKSLRDDPGHALFVWERGKGIVSGDFEWADIFPASMTWKDWAPYGSAKTKDMFGWRDFGESRLVWSRGKGDKSNFVYAAFADIPRRDYAVTIRVVSALVSVVLAALTIAGLMFFRNNAKSRDDFLSAAAHDLSTPLSTMRLMIGKDDESARILADRLLRIVGNIKDFIRLGGSRPRPDVKPFDFAAAYREAYSLFRDDYRDAFDGEDVPFLVEGGGSVFVMGDSTLAVQIIWNILGNDLKYAAPYGKVAVSLREKDGFAEMRFSDSGRGMGKREIKKAFDRYWRARTVLASGRGGFGIGLATAKESAESMGGSLALLQNVPTGLVYVFRLPCAKRQTE